jgi:hypothetical protein
MTMKPIVIFVWYHRILRRQRSECCPKVRSWGSLGLWMYWANSFLDTSAIGSVWIDSTSIMSPWSWSESVRIASCAKYKCFKHDQMHLIVMYMRTVLYVFLERNPNSYTIQNRNHSWIYALYYDHVLEDDKSACRSMVCIQPAFWLC